MACNEHLSRTMAVALVLVLCATAVQARSPQSDAKTGIQAFVSNCFSPFMTAGKAAEAFNFANIRSDFYDLDPFSNVAPSPVIGRAATPGTDRRCEVSFNGDFALQASTAVVAQLASEGITKSADLPKSYEQTESTVLLAARKLNPRRVAVVHVGTRPSDAGVTETFMMVERLLPSGN